MRKRIEDYEPIVGEKIINQIYEESARLAGKHVLHISSTYVGGGVAEMQNALVPLMNSVGITTGWRILHGSVDFFTITKKFHNGLQGQKINLSRMKKKIYADQNESFSVFTHIDHDAVIVHDPQPLPLISLYGKECPWLWRIHIDLSQPWEPLWDYLKRYILRYDALIVSQDSYKKDDIDIPQHIMMPSIDPLSQKNVNISERVVNRYLSKNGIDRDKPIISQISRFDKWKDPNGVLRCFKRVRKEIDCRLVFVGSFASDDPEGEKVLQSLRNASEDNDDVTIIVNASDILVNSVQRASSVIMQKSIREGFAITVSEALWKGVPVVATNVGGLPLQVIDGVDGYLVNNGDNKTISNRLIKLLKDDKLRMEMGKAGRDHVKRNFLVTRHLLDWIRILKIHQR